MRLGVLFVTLFSAAQSVPLVKNPESGATETLEQNLMNAASGGAVAKNTVDVEPATEKDSDSLGSSLIETPSYDPNLYSTLLGNQFNSAFAPFGAPIGYAPAPVYPGGFAVQTGYEGFLMPEIRPAVAPDSFSLLRGFLPRAIIAWILKSSAMILSAISVVFFGGAITTALCSLTPLCSISFKGLPFLKWRETAETVGKVIGTEITSERVRRAADLVSTAIEKYSELQKYYAHDGEEKRTA